jgi:predicted DNA-binding protein
LKLNRSKDLKEKLILTSFRISPDLAKRLAEFSEVTKIPQAIVFREGVELCLAAKQPLLEAARAQRA